MSLFRGNGFYVRNPDADDANFQKVKALGFDVLAVNVRDHAWAEWKTLVTDATAAGLVVIPWARTLTKVEVVALARAAATLPRKAVIINAEDELVDQKVSAEFIASQIREHSLDACVSTVPWLGTPAVDLAPLGKTPIHLQLFPQENGESMRPRDCRAHAYVDARAGYVNFMTGMHGLDRRAFPPLKRPVWIYTLDDCQQELEEWEPIGSDSVLSERTVPFTGPLYGPSHPKYGTRPKRSKTAKALKLILHEAGLGNFPRPDTSYNLKLEQSMRWLQRLAGVPMTGAYGVGSWGAIRGLASASIDGTFACTAAAAELIREDASS